MIRQIFADGFWRSKKAGYLLFLVFLSLNLITKFYYLPEESVYGDEPYSIYHAQKPVSELGEVFLHDQNPPLQIISLHFWMCVFGVSDISAKSLSVILTVLCSIVLFFFSEKFLNRKATIFVSILFLLSDVQLFYSHEARVYPLVQLLCISSFYCYFELVSRPRKSMMLLLALFNLLLLFSHYLAVFILAVQFLAIWMYYFKNRKAVLHYLLSSAIVVVLFSPWIKVMLANIDTSGDFWLIAPDWQAFKFHVFWLNGSQLLFYVFSVIVLSSVLMVLLNKRFRFFSREFDARLYLIFLLWYVLPIGAEFIIGQYIPVFLVRYFLYAGIGLYLLSAYVIANLNTGKWIQILLFLPVFALLLSAFDMKPLKEDDWRTLSHKVKQLQNKRTMIMVSASYKFKDFSFYYDPAAFRDYNNTLKRLASEHVYCSKEGPLGWLNVRLDSVDQVLFVQSHNQYVDSENKIQRWILENGYFTCSDYVFGNASLSVFKSKGMECFPVVKVLEEHQPAAENLWTTQVAIRGDINDTILIYKTDMEPAAGAPASYGVAGQRSRSGSFSCVIDKNNPFSVGISKTGKELNGLREISISANVNYEGGSKGRLVVSLEKAGKISFWNEEPVSFDKPDTWSEIRKTVIIPQKLEDDEILKVYFSNAEEKRVYIDDFRIALAKSG